MDLEDADDVEKAIDLDDTEFKGQDLNIQKPKARKQQKEQGTYITSGK